MLSPAEILSESGPVSTHIENFTNRLQQQEMATEIFAALKNDESLICEAGTGTGKTLAYLVAAILSNRKVIITTGTKHLQDQIFYKDLPIVLDSLDQNISVALLKGRNNYLCLHRMNQLEQEIKTLPEKDKIELSQIKDWSVQTTDGDLTEIPAFSDRSKLWPSITSTADNCLGKECAEYEKCFVFKARKKANNADLIIVNHHLLMADLSLKESGFGEILPKVDSIIFDEAHQLPDLASVFFSKSISSHQIIELLNDSRHAYIEDLNDTPDFLIVLDGLNTAIKQMRLVLDTPDIRLTWQDAIINQNISVAALTLLNSLHKLETSLDQLSERSKSIENCWQRCNRIIELLDEYIERDSDSDIRWVEIRGKGFLLHQTPLDISCLFKSRLEEHANQCIFTSATLAINNNFTHFANRLGLDDVNTKSWSSPYNYQRQALLYLPGVKTDPRSTGYIEEIVEWAIPVIKASKGHTFFLFTSYKALNHAQDLIKNKIDYPVMVQGDAPRTELLNKFRITQNAVLLGTQSFWEGVDVRGQALSCVIIDKLPFAPPDDPVFRARSAKMEEIGQNPFKEYQLPEAIINLRQGVGRLIRNELDYGVMMICDPRLQSKSYGKLFINSLPDMTITDNISEVQKFFRNFE